MTRYIAVVGGKHSGKTTIVQQLIRVLKSRGNKVATIKEMPNIQSIDTPADNHDTWKHSAAGAEFVVALPQNEAVVFIQRKLTLHEIVPFIQEADYAILEGFEKEKLFPKIIAAKSADEALLFSDGLAIAISGIIADSEIETTKAFRLQIPVLSSKTQAEALVDIVEQKAFTILPNLTDCAKCHPVSECGFSSCYEYAKAIVSGSSKAKCCPLDLKENFIIEINGVKVPLKDFPQSIIKNILFGMLTSLHGAKEIKTLKIELNQQ